MLQVELSGDDGDLVQGLIDTGVYGTNPGEAIRAAFMRWCNQHVTLVRRTYLEFT